MGFAAELIADVLCDVVNGAVVALCASNDCFGHSNDIPISGSKAIIFHCLQNGISDDFYHIVAFTDNGGPESDRNSTKRPTHSNTSNL